jgi:hypothetical protein
LHRSNTWHFGASLMFNGELAREAVDDVVAHLKRQKCAFLLPAEAPDLIRTAVAPALLDKAFVRGSPDARSEVFKRIGRDEQKLDALARDYGLRDAKDYRRGIGTRPEGPTARANSSVGAPQPQPISATRSPARGAAKASKASVASASAEYSCWATITAGFPTVEMGFNYDFAQQQFKSADVRFSNRPVGVKRFLAVSIGVSMSPAGSCFSPESAPRPFHHGVRRQGGTI